MGASPLFFRVIGVRSRMRRVFSACAVAKSRIGGECVELAPAVESRWSPKAGASSTHSKRFARFGCGFGVLCAPVHLLRPCVNLGAFLDKFLRLFFHSLFQGLFLGDALLRRVFADVLGNLHRTEMRAAHAAEVGGF